MCDAPCGGSAAGEGCSASLATDGKPRPAAAGESVSDMSTCMKCRERPAQVMARQQEPLCYECLAGQLQTKAHGAIRQRGLIKAGDSIMTAFSGGTASAALLHFLASLRNPRTDRLERRKVAFNLQIVYIDESAAQDMLAEQQAATCEAVQRAAEQYISDGVQYHCVPLEEVFAPEEPDPLRQRQRLQQLLESVADATGREDLVVHLRMHLLLAVAQRLRCSKVARGDCASRLAAHIMAAAAKGCGYGLPGDVQLVDARYGPSRPMFFLPLRELGRRELALLCQHLQLPTLDSPTPAGAAPAAGQAPQQAAKQSGQRGSSINVLAEGFVQGLLAHNPGSVSNILGTISKLQAFPWNDPPELHRLKKLKETGQPGAAERPLPEPQQQPHQGERSSGSPQQLLCPLCLAPLADDELAVAAACRSSPPPSCNEGGTGLTQPPSGAANGTAGAAEGADGSAAAQLQACCFSCRGQVLGEGLPNPSSNSSGTAGSSSVSGLLPQVVRQQMHRLGVAESRACAVVREEHHESAATERLRAQIAEFLLEE